MKNKIEPKLLKGFRDFREREIQERQYLLSRVVEVFELFGFGPLETPAMEYLTTFKSNIGEDEKLFFQFKDNGGRDVALRYDQTVPTCRYIALNLTILPLPYKRYQIQTVWRAEKPQKGRFREFVQCDADIFGVKGPEADAEVIGLGIEIFKSLGFKNFVTKINDRSLYKDIPYSAISAIDKLPKIGKTKVIEEMIAKGFSLSQSEGFLNQIKSIKPNNVIKSIFGYLRTLGIEDKYFEFDPTIARSFSYSTGPVWEVVIDGYSSGSVLGGERFDNLVGRFTDEQIAGTGFGLGFDRTLEALRQFDLLPSYVNKTQVLVTVFNQELFKDSLVVVRQLRKKGINTEVYSLIKDKLDKQLKYANNKQIPYVVILGPDESSKRQITVKNMKQKTQQQMTVRDFIKLLKASNT